MARPIVVPDKNRDIEPKGAGQYIGRTIIEGKDAGQYKGKAIDQNRLRRRRPQNSLE